MAKVIWNCLKNIKPTLFRCAHCSRRVTWVNVCGAMRWCKTNRIIRNRYECARFILPSQFRTLLRWKLVRNFEYVMNDCGNERLQPERSNYAKSLAAIENFVSVKWKSASQQLIIIEILCVNNEHWWGGADGGGDGKIFQLRPVNVS